MTPILILVLKRRFELPRVCPFKQEHLTLSLDDLIVFVTLEDSIPSPRQLGVTREHPRIVVESQEVCIALPFVGIDS
jgi:hypothetical protein